MKSINEANITGAKLQEFIQCVSLLSEVEFLGVVSLLGVRPTNENKEPRPFEEIFSDVIDTFVFLNRKKRRDLMKVLKQITKKRHTRKDIVEDEDAVAAKTMGDVVLRTKKLKDEEEKEEYDEEVVEEYVDGGRPSEAMMEQIDGLPPSTETPLIQDGE